MKPPIPPVNPDVWKDLYAAAARFKALTPWNVLDDMAPACFTDPSDGEMGYGLTMGSGGTIFGFCLYRGAEGFDRYRRLMDGSLDPEGDDYYAVLNCLKLEFGSRNELEKEDHGVIRALGLSFKGEHGWPGFRSFLPGYFPWFLTEVEAQFLTLGLDVACHHHEEVVKGRIEESIRDGECLVYRAADGAHGRFRSRWQPWPEYAPRSVPPVLHLERLAALRGKQVKRDGPWEAGVFYQPVPIMEGDRPFFMRGVAACQQSSGFVFGTDLARPEESVGQLLADAICSAIEKAGMKPDMIFVKHEDVEPLMPFASALGLTIRPLKNLRTIFMLKKAMLEDFLGGGKRRRKR